MPAGCAGSGCWAGRPGRGAWAFRWVRQQQEEVAGIAWMAVSLPLAERAPLAAALVARVAVLAPLAGRGISEARLALQPILAIALPPLAPALNPAQTAALLAHY